MNKKEKEWIRKNLKQIFVTDIKEDNDMQTEHTLEFLMDLANRVGFLFTEKQEEIKEQCIKEI